PRRMTPSPCGSHPLTVSPFLLHRLTTRRADVIPLTAPPVTPPPAAPPPAPPAAPPAARPAAARPAPRPSRCRAPPPPPRRVRRRVARRLPHASRPAPDVTPHVGKPIRRRRGAGAPPGGWPV